LPTPDGAGGPDPVPVARSLDAVMAGLGGPNVETIVTVHERWADVVGSEVVAHARPVSVKGGRLKVAVDSPGWANHLRWAEADILVRLAGLVGAEEITSVTVRVTGR
jgi:predicted nucleic acid-binding Zn ribbon protein